MEEYHERTIDESIAECNNLKKFGKLEDYPFADGDFKVGDIKGCNDCGEPVEVVRYNGFGQFSKNVIVHCEKHTHEFKPSNCTNPKCKGHDDFDEEEYIKDNKEILNIRVKIRDMLEKVDPKIDTIMEYDRLTYITGQMFPKLGSDKWDFWLYNEFIDYLGLKGRLHV